MKPNRKQYQNTRLTIILLYININGFGTTYLLNNFSGLDG